MSVRNIQIYLERKTAPIPLTHQNILDFEEGGTYNLPLSDFFKEGTFDNVQVSDISVSIQQLKAGYDPNDNSSWVNVYDMEIDTELTATVSARDTIQVVVPEISKDIKGGQLRLVVSIDED